MNDEYTIGKMSVHILKNSWKIIILMILAALLTGLPFSFQKDLFTKKNAVEISERIEFTQNALIESSKQYERYNNIWFNERIVARFLQYSEQTFDMEKFFPGWSTKNDSERPRLINGVIYCNPLEGKPQYDIHFNMSASDDNYEYVKTNAPILFENFMKYNIANVKSLYKNSDNIILSYSLKNQRYVSSTMEIIKYFIVGAALGLIIGVFLLLLPFMVYSGERSKS